MDLKKELQIRAYHQAKTTSLKYFSRNMRDLNISDIESELVWYSLKFVDSYLEKFDEDAIRNKPERHFEGFLMNYLKLKFSRIGQNIQGARKVEVTTKDNSTRSNIFVYASLELFDDNLAPTTDFSEGEFLHTLSTPHKEVLNCLAAGLSKAEISKKLDLPFTKVTKYEQEVIDLYNNYFYS